MRTAFAVGAWAGVPTSYIFSVMSHSTNALEGLIFSVPFAMIFTVIALAPSRKQP